MGSFVKSERRKTKREQVRTNVEFIIDGTIELLAAESVNISEEGIRFDSDKPLVLSLRYELGGKTHLKIGQLVWAKRTAEGKMTYGLDFLKKTER